MERLDEEETSSKGVGYARVMLLQRHEATEENPLVSTMAARQRASVEEAALRAVFPQLVEAVRATDIIDQLYERNLLDKNEYEGIVRRKSTQFFSCCAGEG